jgi:phosphoglycerol transferase MdoB-like AlkP superfamily enzyme
LVNVPKAVGLALLKGLGFMVGAVLTPILAFGVWLLLTPDYDGGRQGLGGMIVAAAVVVGLAYAALFFFARSRMSRRHSDNVSWSRVIEVAVGLAILVTLLVLAWIGQGIR